MEELQSCRWKEVNDGMEQSPFPNLHCTGA